MLSDATPIEAHSGQERSALNVFVKKTPAHCVTFKMAPGAVSLEQGMEVGVKLDPSLGALGVLSWDFPRHALSFGEDYEICGLTAGQYRLESSAEKIEKNKLYVDGYASESVTVDKRDVNLGTITLQAAQDVRGMATVRDANSGSTIPSGAQVSLWLNGVRFWKGHYFEADIQPLGAFTIAGVWPDEYELRLMHVPSGYYLLAASQQGRNAAVGGLRPGGGDMQMVLASDGATLRGRALAENGEGSATATVFLIPKSGGAAMAARTDQNGGFEFETGIAPGEYQLTALVGLYEAERADPDVATHFRVSGKDVTLGTRQSLTLDVKVQAVR